MKYIERKNKILALFDLHESLSVQDLVTLLGLSPATVRRDIVRMEHEDLVIRYWGGIKRKKTAATLRKSTLENQTYQINHSAIGQYAASQLQDNELVFIGSGTTTLSMIPFIENKKIHVITNGIPQLEALHKKNIQALLLCGFFKEYSRSLVGKETVEMLSSYQFDRAFLGANGMDEELRLLSADEYEDSIKRLCIQKSKHTYLLVSAEKFHRTAYYAVPNNVAKDVHIITNKPVYTSGNWEEKCGIYTARVEKLLS